MLFYLSKIYYIVEYSLAKEATRRQKKGMGKEREMAIVCSGRSKV
jgi:hypothetical protein